MSFHVSADDATELGAIRRAAGNVVREERRHALDRAAGRSADGVPRNFPAGPEHPERPAAAVPVMGPPS